jgi:peptidyl-prolyl cis-trans isomerase C
MITRHLIRAAAAVAVLALPLAVAAQSTQSAQTEKAAPAKTAPAAKAKPAARGPIATVNGVPVPARRAELLVRERLGQGATDNEQLRAAIREDLIRREVISQEAKRAGYEKKSDVQAEFDLLRQTILVQHYLRDWLSKHPVTDAEMQAEYDRAKSQTGDKEYHARHILVESEDQAKSIIAELKKGAKFEDLAQKHSKDDGNKERGGDLGWNVPGVFDKVFSDAMVKLDNGQLTDTPVHTRFGYHVIRLDETRPVKFPPLAEVKGRIQQQLSQRRIEQLVQELRGKAKVE